MSSAVPGPKVNYQGNSKLDREVAAEPIKAEPKIKKIEGVNVIKTKKSVGRRIKENFGGQDLKTVGLFLLMDVVLPKSRDLIFDLISEGAHRSIYGEPTRRSGPSSSSIVGSSRIRATNYGAASRSPIVGSASVSAPTLSAQERSSFDFSGLNFQSVDKAQEVLERMADAIEEYGTVSVADFYDAIGATGTGFTDQTHGWDARAFAGATVQRSRMGYYLNLPSPIEIA